MLSDADGQTCSSLFSYARNKACYFKLCIFPSFVGNRDLGKNAPFMQLNEFSLLTVTTEKVTVFFLNHRSPFFACAVKDEGLWTTET